MIALEVLKICNKRNVELTDILPQKLDEIIGLAIQSVKQVFKYNGFRLFQILTCWPMTSEKWYRIRLEDMSMVLPLVVLLIITFVITKGYFRCQ